MNLSFEEERCSDSPLIEKIWYSQSEQQDTFTSVASIRSGIVVANVEGKITVTVRGPETQATSALLPANGAFLGIYFKAGTLLGWVSPDRLRFFPRQYTPL